MILKKLGYTIPISKYNEYNGVLGRLQIKPCWDSFHCDSAYCDSFYKFLLSAKSDIYIHSEYWYAFPRLLFASDTYFKSFCDLFYTIIRASFVNKHVKGLVVHIDYPFKKKYLSSFNEFPHNLNTFDFLSQFNSLFFEPITVVRDKLIEMSTHVSESYEFAYLLYKRSILRVFDYLRDHYSYIPIPTDAFLLLENTTHVGDINYGLSYNIQSLINCTYTLLLPNVGFCFDEEHSFASGGPCLFTDIARTNKDNPDFKFSVDNLSILETLHLLHFNIPPDNVVKGSFKDLHSYTSFDSDGIFTSYYLYVLSFLILNKIPFIREIKSEIMEQEIKFLHSLLYDS